MLQKSMLKVMTCCVCKCLHLDDIDEEEKLVVDQSERIPRTQSTHIVNGLATTPKVSR